MEERLNYYKTDDYSRFKFFEFNRTAGSNKKIGMSIDMVDMTEFCPIIVTPDYHIVDGQNRFLNCKEKGKPVYYIIYSGDAEKAMIALNTATVVWKQKEWLHYYVSKESPNYVAMKYLMDKHKIDISNSILLFSHHKTNSTDFKNGKLQDNSRLFEAVVDFIKSVVVPKDVRWQRPFVSAVMDFIYDHEDEPKKIKKLERRITSIVKYARIEDYRNAFENLVR